MAKQLCIVDTMLNVVRPVYPRYANRYGTLHGGRAAWWLLEAAAMAAMRLSRGYVVLGAIDYLYILSPGRLGENIYIYAVVAATTRHTLDVATAATAVPVGGGEERLIAASMQTFVAVDDRLSSRPVGVEVAPCSRGEEPLAEKALDWRRRRAPLVERRREVAADTQPIEARDKIVSYMVVSHDMTFSIPTVLDASKLFYTIDQVAAIAGIRAAKGPVVTAGFDEAVFAAPAWVGDMVRIEAAVSGAGRTSIETLVKIVAEKIETGEQRTMAMMYTTLVSVGPDGRPAPPSRRPEPDPRLVEGYGERREKRAVKRRIARETGEAVTALARLRGSL